MKKRLLFFLLTAAITAAQAQISTYPDAQKANFMALGGYAYTETQFPSGFQAKPYIRSGPSPENTFSFAATVVYPGATGNQDVIYNYAGALSSYDPNRPILLTFIGNNVRKFGAEVFGTNQSGAAIAGTVQMTATTNFGISVTLSCDLNSRFAGFQVTGENEYLTSVVFTPPATGIIWASIYNVILGDDTPQNVALNLDGVNDYVAIPSAVGNFNTNENFTVSAWVRPGIQTDLGAGDNDMIEKWNGAGGYPFVVRFFNQTAGGNAGKIAVGRYDGINGPNITSSVTINDGKWHHIAFVKNGTSLALYIDGVSAGTTTDNCTAPTTNTSLLYIGRRGNGINYFKGDIDEVRIRSVALTQAQIQNDMFCKLNSVTNLAAAYNFNEGVPNGNNVLLTQVNNLTGSNHGTLTNLAKTGNSSNFVTGQIHYVKADAVGANNGSSWANAYTSLQSALAIPTGSTCNDMIEVWVAKGTYKPHANDVNTPFSIPSAYRLYGGFAGTEASLNQRNPALLLTTNLTTLSGDLSGNDTPNFGNRADNAINVVRLQSVSENIIDGFEVKGATDIGLYVENSTLQIDRCKLTDNQAIFGGGAYFTNSNVLLRRCMIMGNSANYGAGFFAAVFTGTKSTRVLHCLITGNKAMTAGGGVLNKATTSGAVHNVSYTNCTLAGNAPEGMRNEGQISGIANLTLTNVLMYGNGSGITINNNSGGSTSTTITYSLVQGVTTGTGNLNGNTVNPNFMDLPAFASAPTTAGDFHLKWCSKAINSGINPIIGNNAGQLPLDLDRTPAPFEGTYDMGVYEYLGNTPSGVNNATIASTITGTTYTGTGEQTIISTAKILPPAGTVLFNAPNSVLLQPGFEAQGMQSFKAQIGPNVTCTN
ncbi:MAG: LamG domain-containing protein [Spirosomataceae bacterium]